MSLLLNGIGVSRGIVIGTAHVLRNNQLEIPEYEIPATAVPAEVERLKEAVNLAREQLTAIRHRVPERTPADIRAFIDTHLLMLDDASLSEAPERLVRSQHCNAEWALKQQRDSMVNVFEAMDDPYLRTRRDDVDHVVNRIQRILLRLEGRGGDAGHPMDGRVVVAEDLTPADAALFHDQGAIAFVTEFGGPLSHTVILARSLRIPAVVGVRGARRYVRDNETLVIDGRDGVIVAAPDTRALKHYESRQREQRRYIAELGKLKATPAITRDGHPITLQANIELPDDVLTARRAGAAGVGLYRTEFLFMNRDDMPDEEEQFETYVGVVQRLKGAPLTIRSLDLGADKEQGASDIRAVTPALGLRGIRLCLHDPLLFTPQLRAILRASAHGPVRLMVPMFSNVHEIFQLLHLVEDVKRALRREGLAFDESMPLGAMIEVPAAALCAHLFAERLDFLSIGTNDLIQYTLAIDRIDDTVNYLYDPLHPAVLRLIHTTLQAGHRAGIPVGMCGEMAGDPRLTRLLLGLGLEDFSMPPSSLLEVKRIVKESRIADLTRPAREILRSHQPHDTARLLELINAR